MRLNELAGRKGVVSRSGFTLAEVMIGVFVMAIMFVGLYLGFSQGFGIIQVTRENLRATQILQEKMETIRLFTWDDLAGAANPYAFTAPFYPLGGTGSQGVIYTGTRTISSAPVSESYSNDMKLVTVQLTWTSGKVQRQREMKTLVSRYGLHNYIFFGAQ
jgi:prepilin-type N-terminal cleavage/methylation domain-containing protein